MTTATTRQRVFVSFAALALLATVSVAQENAKGLKLSERTVAEFKKFKEHVQDAEERQRLASIILAIAPFRVLLDGAGPDALYEIADTDWSTIATALQGLAAHSRTQLKTFCELEALSQHRSRDDFRFWRDLAQQFLPKSEPAEVSGRWRRVVEPNHRGGVPELSFTKTSTGSYEGAFRLTVEGEAIEVPLETVEIKGRDLSFHMKNGSTVITFLLRLQSDGTTLEGRASTPQDRSGLSFKKL